MPLYNNAATVERAIRSLLQQTHRDLLLFVSDDCSTDRTAEISRAFARSDGRVQVATRTRNLGYLNFRHVLMAATTPYFMWAAGDDWWSPDYVARCLNLLEADAHAVCAVSKCRFYSAGQATGLALGTSPLESDPRSNLFQFLSNPADNTRMYGVFRTEVAKTCFPDEPFHAYDWAFSAATLRHGKRLEVDAVLLHRDLTPSERYLDLAHKDGRTASERIFPLLANTRWLLREARIPKDRRILGALLALNLEKHWDYAARYLPNYFWLVRPLSSAWKRVAWRLKRVSDRETP